MLPSVERIIELPQQADLLHPPQEARDIGGIDDERPGEVGGAHPGRLAGEEVEHIELRGREPVRLEDTLGLLLQDLGGREYSVDEVHADEAGFIS